MKTSKFTGSFVVNTAFYKWRAKYGGMHTSLLARMKVLEYVVQKGKAKFLN